MSPKRLRRLCNLALLPALSVALCAVSTQPTAGQDNRQYLPLIASPGLSTPQPTPQPTAQPTPDPSANVVARNFSGYYDLGDYFLMGEVANNTAAPVYSVELAVTYYDAAGNILAAGDAAPSLERIEPGATVPVRDVHFGAPEGIARYTILVKGWKNSSLVGYQPLTILSAEKQIGVSGVIVSGQGRNDAAKPVENVLLVASFRDSSGTVVSVEYDYPVIGALQPGQRFDYTIETFDDTLAGTNVMVQGQASLAP